MKGEGGTQPGAHTHHPLAVFTFVAICAVVFLFSACAQYDGSKKASVVKECVLPTEQANTLQGKWKTYPIKISFSAADWPSAQEIQAIQAGAETWNSFFDSSKQIKIFDAGPTGVGYKASAAGVAATQSGPACTSGTLSDGVIIYKRYASWPKDKSFIALTTSCLSTADTSATGGRASIFNAVLEFNYVNFFSASSRTVPDLQSIAVHELGHVFGLDHSCGPLNKPNQTKSYTVCPDFNSNPSNFMVSAVMYPKVPFTSPDGQGFRYGQVKQALTDNDEGRANCLY